MYLMQNFLLFAATVGWLPWLGNLALVILMVAGGLGFVIFVHELGHFLVAKACGVKCEKFYLGFDIAGLKLFKFQWGETEYGIGILPLGGYVKMLGQDDNPAGEAADMERAKIEPLDPRSYKAKSVPQRMAIISAGVIMNLIFAVIFAAIAYYRGVIDQPCMISGTLPGEIAWQADMQPGDKILQINDQPNDGQLRFRDLTQAVVLSNPDDGVRFKIQRDGVAEPFWLTLKPERAVDRLAPMIGATGPQDTKLRETPVSEGTPTARLGFKQADKIVAVDGKPVHDNAELQKLLAHHPDAAVRLTVARPKLDDHNKPTGDVESLSFDVPPNPLKTLGLVMKMGPIAAIRKNSPAAEAGLLAGDQIVSIDGEAVGNPITLPERMRRKAGTAVEIVVNRRTDDGNVKPLTLTITPRMPDWWEESVAPTSPLAAPALGIAYRVPGIIEAVEPGSPAEKAALSGKGAKPESRLAAGMEITQVKIIVPPRDKNAKADEMADQLAKLKPIKLGTDGAQWPNVDELVQLLKPGIKFELTLAGDQTVELESAPSKEWYNPDRGFRFEPVEVTIEANSPGQALAMGVRETRDSVRQVYGFLRRIGTRISPMGLGGPIAIATEAGHQANRGFSELLIFLTMLSANLAVINFLPIPILDGGHMVFLLAEAVMRRPVSERVAARLHLYGAGSDPQPDDFRLRTRSGTMVLLDLSPNLPNYPAHAPTRSCPPVRIALTSRPRVGSRKAVWPMVNCVAERRRRG